MLPKLKHLLPIFALALGIGTALLISRVKAYADDVPNGESVVRLNDNNWSISALTYNGFATIDYVDQFESNGVYYSTIGTTSEILLNLYLGPLTPVRGNYINGVVVFGYKPNITLTAPTGFTLSNLKYSMALVYSSNDNVNCSIQWSSNAGYTFRISFNDYYDFYGNEGLGLTVAFRINGTAQWSGSEYHRPNAIPCSIGVDLLNLDSQVSFSEISFHELQIKNAIDSSVDTQGILDQLITANAHMVWSDGSAVYDVADLLWMINGSQMTANSTLQSQYNQDTATQALVNQILSAITTDSSGVSSATEQQVNQAHTLEGNAQTAFNNILGNLQNGDYSGYSSGMTYGSGLASLELGKTSTHRIVVDNVKAIDFWKRVGDELLDRSVFGSIAAFLMVVLMLGFTAWVLKL